MQFKTKANRLTPYALSCGYIEVVEYNSIRVTLYAESTSYHVKAFDYRNSIITMWDTFHTLTQARKQYDRYIKSIRAIH